MRTALILRCTDRGQHASVQIARVAWTGQADEHGVSVWTAGDGTETIEAVAENTRQTRAGQSRVTKRRPVDVTTRADGGRTFHLPRCQRCGKSMDLRDDTLEKLRQLPGESCDLSLLRW